MILQMGFSAHWVQLVMFCVSIVSYTIVSGSHEIEPITPQRGIRQGDPLSPYLFLLIAEGLSALLRRHENIGLFSGIKVARRAPSVSHIFFADDCYLFCKATEGDTLAVKNLLQLFQSASGQEVNLLKSFAYFSRNTSSQTRKDLCSILSISEATANSLYLGLPNSVGRNKRALFGFIKEKLSQKILSWESNFLSKAGKELLLKTVAHSMPTYAMGVFLLPISLCHDLEKLMSSFWWKSKAGAKPSRIGRLGKI